MIRNALVNILLLLAIIAVAYTMFELIYSEQLYLECVNEAELRLDIDDCRKVIYPILSP